MSDDKMINGFPHIPYARESYSPEEMLQRAQQYYQWLDQRRTVRDISNQPVSREVIEQIVSAASSAPSGAHKQPWTFCLVSDSSMKKKIREAAEEEEYQSYHGRMSDRWLQDLQAIGTDWHKPFLEEAPWLIIVFKKVYELENGEKHNNYYVNESVGLACGFLLTAIHHAGLVALTHTPSPMNFLSKILDRPANERPFLLIPVGYPKDEALVPDLQRKSLSEVAVFFE
ncbi:MAG: nitroreductase family protein [Cyclobacteriaceae bacterium]|nr:nitroreductase family protein [Cyclobacteriaceae bacterium]